ncbi:hypothetical protein NST50_03470 [Paenibacillus sp. FSL E2-0202]|uniref:hypothetical protein n=1 Tax=Paenibacillus sp. FSL E2-0202 TaxID=2954505 RepID=UPI0030EE0B7F
MPCRFLPCKWYARRDGYATIAWQGSVWLAVDDSYGMLSDVSLKTEEVERTCWMDVGDRAGWVLRTANGSLPPLPSPKILRWADDRCFINEAKNHPEGGSPSNWVVLFNESIHF